MTARRAYPAALAAIVLLGAALRLLPVWFGLPYPHARPDEETTVGHAVAVLAGDPNPHFFNWPSLTFYVLAGVFRILSLARTLSAADQVIAARTVVAIAGTATILVVARLASRTAGPAAGLVTALFLAVATLHVRDSHFATTDVGMTLLATAALAALVEAGESGSIGLIAIAGLLAGLAASAKYSAAALAVSILPVQWLWWKRSRDLRPAVWFLAAMGFGFVAGTPFAILDAPGFVGGVLEERRHLAGGHGAADLGVGWVYHLARTLPYGLGFGIFAASIAGVFPLLRHHTRAALVTGAFAAAFYAAIGSGHTVFFRYVLPLVPIACLSAAVAVTRGSAWLAGRTRTSRVAMLVLLAALVAAPSLMNSVRLDWLLARTDSRVVAARWLAPRLRPESTVYDSGGDYTRLDLGALPFHDWRYDERTRSFGDPEGRTPDWIVIDNAPLHAYAAAPPSASAPLRR
jgi:4-amino-4-deoxy-L-arabinose transferase-like glycosyltransferase